MKPEGPLCNCTCCSRRGVRMVAVSTKPWRWRCPSCRCTAELAVPVGGLIPSSSYRPLDG